MMITDWKTLGDRKQNDFLFIYLFFFKVENVWASLKKQQKRKRLFSERKIETQIIHE